MKEMLRTISAGDALKEKTIILPSKIYDQFRPDKNEDVFITRYPISDINQLIRLKDIDDLTMYVLNTKGYCAVSSDISLQLGLELNEDTICIMDKNELCKTKTITVKASFEFDVEVEDLDPNQIDIRGLAIDLTKKEVNTLSSEDFDYTIIDIK